jgi:hypothetical protein
MPSGSSPWANIERLLSDAIDIEVEVRGPIAISYDWEPTISIADVVAVESDLPSDLKAMSAKSLSLKLPLLPLLPGQVRLNSLAIDGLKVDVGIPKGGAAADEPGSGKLTGRAALFMVRPLLGAALGPPEAFCQAMDALP